MAATFFHFYKRWFTLVFDPGKSLSALRRFITYLTDWRAYSRRSTEGPLRFIDSHPCLFDQLPSTPFDTHYTYQAAWVMEKITHQRTENHVDVGSEIRFVAMLSGVVPVTFIDIRPPAVEGLPGLTCKKGSLLALPYPDGSIPSLSCTHVAEHVGLGRYGDPLEPDGTKKAIMELARVLAPGGNLYFSIPIGRPRVCFNAHRILHPLVVTEWFGELELIEFSVVTDQGRFLRNVDPRDFIDARYANGLYWFTKGDPD